MTAFIVLSALGILAGQGVAQAEKPDDILIVANKSLKAGSISIADAKRIFLKEKADLNGERITPVNARSGSALRNAFAVKVLGMSGAEETGYWEDQKIKTGTHKPTELADTVKAVFSLKNGISYCYRKDFNPAVAKILLAL